MPSLDDFILEKPKVRHYRTAYPVDSSRFIMYPEITETEESEYSTHIFRYTMTVASMKTVEPVEAQWEWLLLNARKFNCENVKEIELGYVKHVIGPELHEFMDHSGLPSDYY